MVSVRYPAYPGGVDPAQIIGLSERGYDRAVDQRNERDAKAVFGRYVDSLYGGQGQPQTLSGLQGMIQPSAPAGNVQRARLPDVMDPATARVEQAFAAQGQGRGDSNSVAGRFLKTVRDGGVTNPYALAAIAATGKAESGFDPRNATRVWSDPSQSGQAGTAGGIMSWRNERLRNLQQFAQQNGDDPNAPSPETQAKFLLAEDPSLIQKLQNAGSAQEAQQIMNNAWRFAGYNQPGGEAARRMESANAYAQQFGGSPSSQALESLAVGQSAPVEQGVQVADASGAVPAGAMPQGDTSSLLPPREVMAAMFANPVTRPLAAQLAQSVIKMRAGQADPKTQLEYQIAVEKLRQLRDPQSKLINAGGGMIYDPNTKSWISPPEGSGNPETGLQPQMMRNPQTGETIFVQPTKDGRLLKSQVPEGFQPYDPYEKSYQTSAGKAGGEAAANLPTVETNANAIFSMIDSLANDPYLDSMLGPINSRKPNLSADSERVQSKMDQIGGQSFLQAFNMLRGGGQITEVEGQKATAAMARLNTAQSPKDYREALGELRDIVQRGVEKARRQAGGNGGGSSAPKGNRTSSGVQWSIEE